MNAAFGALDHPPLVQRRTIDLDVVPWTRATLPLRPPAPEPARGGSVGWWPRTSRSTTCHWFTMRRSLVRFQRLVVSMREVVSAIIRREQHLIGDLAPYYQDVYDHILRIGESSDSLRELGSTIVETNLALRDFRQNQVMKRVGSWVAIIAVPTFVTGYYGMNVPYPGFASPVGAAIATGLSLGLPVGLYLYFRRRDWL